MLARNKTHHQTEKKSSGIGNRPLAGSPGSKIKVISSSSQFPFRWVLPALAVIRTGRISALKTGMGDEQAFNSKKRKRQFQKQLLPLKKKIKIKSYLSVPPGLFQGIHSVRAAETDAARSAGDGSGRERGEGKCK